ncbi:dynein heavy chain [Acrasis kona]|uniref:Dynein heavy chain n=1 Tax=Acrasis kona TaxID=1008807 RepID=A0AAW2YQT9_9EUKA
MRQFKIELKECEDNLLFELSNAKGDILENKKLIENLEMTKAKSKQITLSVAEIEENNKKIDASRQVYRPVSVRGSMLYFLIDQLSNLDHMYQYSLEAFMVVFNKALDKAKPADSVDERVVNIEDSITETLFSYVSRGLFERHKLIFSTMLCFGVLKKQNDIDVQQLEFLLRGPKYFGEERPETVAGWCSEASWAAVKALTEIEGTTPAFSTLPADMAGSWRRWKEWCEFEKPEEKPLPLEWKNLEPFQKLLIIRCLRPDRLTWSVTNFVGSKIGTKYVVQAPMDLAASYVDAGPTTPIFFILSPGVDPVKSVESLGETLGFTEAAGKLKNVSLGQGQEPIAEEGLEMAFRNGGWVILNNLHLTPEWLITLEKKLDHYAEVFARQRMAAQKKKEELVAAAALTNQSDKEEGESQEESSASEDQLQQEPSEPTPAAAVVEPVANDQDDEDDDQDDKGHPDFRVFLSAEPSPKIPLGVLQRSIKLTNEPPSGLRANLLRAFMQFNDTVWESSTKQTEFKGILFSLCFFHAVIVERKKFGPQGWNRNYPFSLGDLTTCIAVLNNYLEDRPKVPWEDLRYVFGEIMYGGHITDDWDRRLCSTYFAEYIRAEVVETIQLCPGFQSPPTNLTYQGYLEYIETQLPSESPTAFGLHPNAEIGFRTAQGENLFRMIVEMQPRSGGGGEGMSATEKVAQEIANIMDRLPEQYNLVDIVEKLDAGDERTPFQNSFYQECEYMNRLLVEIDRSLRELKSGLDGELTISDKMQNLMDALYSNKVPETWTAVAYPSLRPLDMWVTNLLERCAQLTAWTQDLNQPKVVWLSGLFNPQSFLTAIMQSTARKMQWPLDKMTLVAEVTKKMRPEEIDVGAREGAYVSGFFLEGATWDEKKNSLVESKLKELYPKMPIIHIKAMQVEKSDPKSFYDCPVYKIQDRGPDYVFCCKLKTKDPPSKWILGGVSMLLDVVE